MCEWLVVVVVGHHSLRKVTEVGKLITGRGDFGVSRCLSRIFTSAAGSAAKETAAEFTPYFTIVQA